MTILCVKTFQNHMVESAVLIDFWYFWKRWKVIENNENCFKRAKVGEHTFFATFFIFFSSRTEKCYSFSQTFFGSLRRFLHSLHSTPVASVRYVWSGGLLRPPLRPPLKGTPAFAPDFTTLRSRLHDPSLLSFRSVRFEKSFGIQKSLSRTKHFSVLLS